MSQSTRTKNDEDILSRHTFQLHHNEEQWHISNQYMHIYAFIALVQENIRLLYLDLKSWTFLSDNKSFILVETRAAMI